MESGYNVLPEHRLYVHWSLINNPVRSTEAEGDSHPVLQYTELLQSQCRKTMGKPLCSYPSIQPPQMHMWSNTKASKVSLEQTGKGILGTGHQSFRAVFHNVVLGHAQKEGAGREQKCGQAPQGLFEKIQKYKHWHPITLGGTQPLRHPPMSRHNIIIKIHNNLPAFQWHSLPALSTEEKAEMRLACQAQLTHLMSTHEVSTGQSVRPASWKTLEVPSIIITNQNTVRYECFAFYISQNPEGKNPLSEEAFVG